MSGGPRYVVKAADEARALVAAGKASDDDFFWCEEEPEAERCARLLNLGDNPGQWTWGDPSLASRWTVWDTAPPAPSEVIASALDGDDERDERERRVVDMIRRGVGDQSPLGRIATAVEKCALHIEECALHIEATTIKLDECAAHLGTIARVAPKAAKFLAHLTDAWENTAQKRASLWRGVVTALGKYAPDPEAKRKR